MTIRVAESKDIPGIKRLGVEALECNEFIIADEKLQKTAHECIDHGFAWVSEKNGVIVAAVCALVHPMPFYYGNQASVVQFYSKAPGDGVKLMRCFTQWARDKDDVRMFCFTLGRNVDPRVKTLLQRLGLQSQGALFLEIKS